MPTVTPGFETFLPPWIARQRWYRGGADPVLSKVGSARLEDPDGEVGIEWWMLRDDAGPERVVYLVPLTYRGEPLADDAGLVARTTHSELGERWIYDAPQDPLFGRLVLGAIAGDVDAPGLDAEPADTATLPAGDGRLLTGEQSNSSIVVGPAAGQDAAPVIVKVFRVLDAGANPDAELTAAVSGAGSTAVPRVVGALAGTWRTGDEDGGQDAAGRDASGHVAVATEFLAGADDAWEVAVESARTGTDFRARARALGAVVGEIHRHLFTLGTAVPGSGARNSLTAEVEERLARASASAPEVGGLAEKVRSAVAGGVEADWPVLQRIHGDLHLGQVLDVPGRGWVVLDFEGEPLRSLADRRLPDTPERDVAGMLRSFDYAAGTARAAGAEPAATRAWAAGARRSFVAGWESVAGRSVRGPLLDASEVAKALYEIDYEARYRPDWLDVPLDGLRTLLSVRSAPGDAVGNNDGMSAEPAAVHADVLAAVAEGTYHDPHSVLGAHPGAEGVTIRALAHLADAVTIVTAEGRVPAEHEHGGIWSALLPGTAVPDYRLEVTHAGERTVVDDPYRFLPTIGEVDLHLIAEGRHETLWTALGAHVRRFPSVLGEVTGVSFTVWAPNAQAVRVVGDHNGWEGRRHAMRSLGGSGVWELFVPGVAAGQRYKFQIRTPEGHWVDKADPMARRAEVPPATASVVTETEYTWRDDEWMAARSASDPHAGPISVYEVHLASWRPGLSYVELADELVKHVTYLGFTHVELMPVAEHPFGGSWGYQVTGYYAPTSRMGTPDELRFLIDTLHRAGIGVIVDWVPAHFPKDSFALARFDGTALYEDPDPLRGEQPDWGTYVFNYGRREVRNFLVANATYWLEEFHVDGLRVDAVASMLYLDYSREPGRWRPNERGGRENLEAISFLQETNATAYRRSPGVMMIAEESTAWPGITAMTSAGGIGFGLKWNMGWMNDTLRYLAEEPINRRYHHGELTFSMVYAYSEQFILPISHDEVVHGKGSLLAKMPGDYWQQRAGVRALLGYQWSHPGKQLLFMGQEFAQGAEWNEGTGLDWAQAQQPEHDAIVQLVHELNRVYRERPAMWSQDFRPEGFEWIEAGDGDHNVLTYLRRSADGTDHVMVVVNFAGTAHEDYRVGVPDNVPGSSAWREILTTDDERFGGSGILNTGDQVATDTPWSGRSRSITLRVPALSAIWLEPVGGEATPQG
ncbi:1,4-alpha-glucan branching protein GlgB [Georgenia sp. Z1344]|uniref:1,4-alpha-glucan branching protein GlgB n=1 Tax=Georgenia sp. Z1344 TaxID=3416706 RepID=UPI003CF3F83E